MARVLNYCGWGFEGEGLTPEEETDLLASYSRRFGGATFVRQSLPPADAAPGINHDQVVVLVK